MRGQLPEKKKKEKKEKDDRLFLQEQKNSEN